MKATNAAVNVIIMISVTAFISFIHTYDISMKARLKSHHISRKLQTKKIGH